MPFITAGCTVVGLCATAQVKYPILNARFMALRGVWMGGCAGFPPGKNFRLSPTRHFAFQKRRSPCGAVSSRSEEHTSELQSLMRISYAVFCLKKKNSIQHPHTY